MNTNFSPELMALIVEDTKVNARDTMRTFTDGTVYDGFTERELHCAFDMVKYKENWKMPIDAEIAREDVGVVDAALRWFVGGCAVITQRPGNKLHIHCPGYYETIGA